VGRIFQNCGGGRWKMPIVVNIWFKILEGIKSANKLYGMKLSK